MEEQISQNTSEYVGKNVVVKLHNPLQSDSEVRGTVLATNDIGIKLEIKGRTKLYHNFYTWNSVREIICVVKEDKDEGEEQKSE